MSIGHETSCVGIDHSEEPIGVIALAWHEIGIGSVGKIRFVDSGREKLVLVSRLVGDT
jgi:hypothetical protein